MTSLAFEEEPAIIDGPHHMPLLRSWKCRCSIPSNAEWEIVPKNGVGRSQRTFSRTPRQTHCLQLIGLGAGREFTIRVQLRGTGKFEETVLVHEMSYTVPSLPKSWPMELITCKPEMRAKGLYITTLSVKMLHVANP